MLGPIYVFHTVERERTALERDLARVALPVKTFASAGALALASVEEAPSLVIWDLDAGKVRGGPDRVATRFRCPVVGLTTDRERVSEADRMPSLVLPAERWRVAPIVLRLLGQAQREEPPAREASPLPPPVSNIFTRPRVLSDTEVDAKRGPKDREEAAPGAHALPVSRTAATVKKPMTVRAPRAGRAPGVGSAAAASAAAAATAAAVAPGAAAAARRRARGSRRWPRS
ncbi:MAG: hypothetical protein H6745_26320 [Deltaproteobacteria bacterium]|nr:hypothetical protein [Deltaproteobacteria bacterium]